MYSTSNTCKAMVVDSVLSLGRNGVVRGGTHQLAIPQHQLKHTLYTGPSIAMLGNAQPNDLLILTRPVEVSSNHLVKLFGVKISTVFVAIEANYFYFVLYKYYKGLSFEFCLTSLNVDFIQPSDTVIQRMNEIPNGQVDYCVQRC